MMFHPTVLLILSTFTIYINAAATSKAKFKEITPVTEEEVVLQDGKYWREQGEHHLRKILEINAAPQKHVAKNVIIFVGDGMGISTITAARIYKGQRFYNKKGEEHSLSFEAFPNLALVKTYNVDFQVPDSAGTATALFTGVKTRLKMVGLDAKSNTSTVVEDLYEKSKVTSIMTWAQEAGKDTGIVTTTRLSHATPACTYAHANHRDWECDSKIPEGQRGKIKDIMRQLVEDEPGKNFKVILGGGTQMLGHIAINETDACMRSDGLNLTKTWIENHNDSKYVFATDSSTLSTVTDDTEYLFGVFAPNHLPYNLVRERSTPSLMDMTKRAIQVLKKNEKGYVLMVEGGRIDHSHHNNYARSALEETSELDDAVAYAVKAAGDDTLIMVTADHSHAFTINGYPRRGTDILGYGNTDQIDQNLLTLAYGNGPGFTYQYQPNKTSKSNPWRNVVEDPNRSTNNFYQHIGSFYLEDETHGGEDVALFARGPGSQLFRGVIEQNYVAHVISYAGCIGPHAKLNTHCNGALFVAPNVFIICIVFKLLYFSL